jgi:hypothetical protein
MRPGLYAFAAAACFLGAAVYIGLVEQPARLALGGPAMIKEWAQSNHRGTVMMSVLAVVSAIFALISIQGRWRRTLDHWRRHYFWRAGLQLLCDGASQYMALCRSAGEACLAGAQTDAGLGVAVCDFAWVLEPPAR